MKVNISISRFMCLKTRDMYQRQKGRENLLRRPKETEESDEEGGGGGGACNVNLGKRRRERAEKTHCVYFAFFVCDYDGYGEGG